MAAKATDAPKATTAPIVKPATTTVTAADTDNAKRAKLVAEYAALGGNARLTSKLGHRRPRAERGE